MKLLVNLIIAFNHQTNLHIIFRCVFAKFFLSLLINLCEAILIVSKEYKIFERDNYYYDEKKSFLNTFNNRK